MARHDPAGRLRLDELISQLASAFVMMPPGEVGAEIERWPERLVDLIGVEVTFGLAHITKATDCGRVKH